MEVGQKVYLKPTGNAARYSKEIKEDIVSKVGRKYFETEGMPRSRFFIDSMKMDGGQYVSNYKAYNSLKEYEDEVETIKINDTLSKYFSRTNSLPLSKLKEIERIINCA